jgi:hypothetical protein
MYSHGQTLRHKETNCLVRLVPQNDDSAWYWPGEGATLFYGEDGTTFVGKLKDYTHINDEFGRAAIGRVKEGEFVDTSLKKYLVSEEKLADLREKSLSEWAAKVLNKLITIGIAHNPFADGSFCTMAKEYFLKKHNAKQLHLSYNSITKKSDFMYCHQYVMKIDGKVWLYDEQMGYITPTSLEHLKKVVKSLE